MPALKINVGDTIYLNPEYVDKLIQHYGSQKIPLIVRMGINPLLVHKVEKKQQVLPGSTLLENYERITISLDGKYYYFDINFCGADFTRNFVTSIPVFVSRIYGKTDKIVLSEFEIDFENNEFCVCRSENIYMNFADNHPFLYCRDCKKERVL